MAHEQRAADAAVIQLRAEPAAAGEHCPGGATPCLARRDHTRSAALAALAGNLVKALALADADVLEEPCRMAATVVVPHLDAVGQSHVLGGHLNQHPGVKNHIITLGARIEQC